MKKSVMIALMSAAMGLVSAPVFAAGPPALAVKDVDNGARQPWSFIGSVHMSYPDFIGGSNEYVVPAGKRLVVEQVSVRVKAPQGQLFHGYLNTNLSGGHFFDIPYKGMFYADGLSLGNTMLRMYVAPGDHFSVSIFRAGNDASASAEIFASGYLVDLP